MPNIEDLKSVLNSSLLDLRHRVDDIEKMMFFINSLGDIQRNRFVVKAVIELKKILAPLPAFSTYMEPKNIIPPPKELEALHKFYQQMHFSLFEIRSKMRLARLHVPTISSVEQAVSLMRTVKSIKEVIIPTSDEIRRQLEGLPIPEKADLENITEIPSVSLEERDNFGDEDLGRLQELKLRQENILFHLKHLQKRLDSIPQLSWPS